MNWKDEAVEKLRRYPVMVNAVQTIPKELEWLTEEARSLQAVRMGTGGVRNLRAQENRLMDNLVRRQELERLHSQAQMWVELTTDAMGKLTEQERELLSLLYMQSKDVSTVCRALGVERSTLYRNRDTALKKLTLALYGALES